MKCERCGKEFEGHFCPNCGEAVGSTSERYTPHTQRESPPIYTDPVLNGYRQTKVEIKEPFYSKTWFVLITLLFCCFPLGLFLMWKYKKFNTPVRVILTTILCLSYMWSIANMLAFSELPSAPSLTQKPNIETAAPAAPVKKPEAARATEEKAENIPDTDAANAVSDAKIPTEYKSALKKAEIYSDTMYMSKQGVYNQLTSEYGEKFSAEAAQYAIDNMTADWNKNALKKAETYSETMYMSKQGVYDQLVSEYGELFTPEEAQYAIDNIEADWNRNALEKAKTYQDTMSMSPAAIHDQLTSEYGEKFTQEEADYAIANLN